VTPRSSDSIPKNIRLNRIVRVIAAIVFVAAALAWSVFTFRLSALFVTLVLIVVLSINKLRRRQWLVTSLVVLAVCLPFQPVDIALFARPGGPKFLRCCPGAPYSDWRKAEADDRAGVCLFCSDLGTAFNPYWYLVLVGTMPPEAS
jgi:hypothetical protein